MNTPQTKPLAGRETEMSSNHAGGFTFQIDDMARLQRFLVLGSASNTHYATARTLTEENLSMVEALLKAGRGKEVVDKIVEVSDTGRGISNDPALFALARCCAADDVETRQAAYAALPKVARIGTHLLHFMAYVKQFRGRGRTHRRAIRAWYQDKTVEQLAYQLLKYQQRDGWSQRDVLRLARPLPEKPTREFLYGWSVKGWDEKAYTRLAEAGLHLPLELLWAAEQAKHAPNDRVVAALIKQHHLPREAIPTEHLKSLLVWEALLEDGMPIEAMVRNLATMTRNGVLVPLGSFTRSVVAQLRNQEAIRKARLHPMKILAALMTYQGGKSARGSSTWTPLRQITDALNDAFYLAFGNVEPTGKRFVLGLDISGSMGSGEIANLPGMTPRVASAAMALVTAATEPNYTIMGFSHQFVPLAISPKQRLDDVVKAISHLPFEGTDCARPMLWAMKQKVLADVFIVYTDNETWQGNIHASVALKMYREQFGIAAKLIVVGMTATECSIADPKDGGMLDVVGMDASLPEVISSFLSF